MSRMASRHDGNASVYSTATRSAVSRHGGTNRSRRSRQQPPPPLCCNLCRKVVATTVFITRCDCVFCDGKLLDIVMVVVQSSTIFIVSLKNFYFFETPTIPCTSRLYVWPFSKQLFMPKMQDHVGSKWLSRALRSGSFGSRRKSKSCVSATLHQESCRSEVLVIPRHVYAHTHCAKQLPAGGQVLDEADAW